MKSLNLLNRCTILFLRLVLLLTQVLGSSVFVYDKSKQQFCVSSLLRSYAMLVLLLLSALLLAATYCYVMVETSLQLRFLLANGIVLLVRVHLLYHSDQCVRLLNEMFALLKQLTQLARHSNIFRLSHLVLLLLTVQSLLRSLSLVYTVSRRREDLFWLGICLFLLYNAVLFTFLLQVSINICLFVVIIACYDELHQCTRRISHDVRRLRQAQLLYGGQLLVLIKQLNDVTDQLVELRARSFRLIVRLIRHFRFHWLWTFLYWLLPIVSNKPGDEHIVYQQTISTLNILFYCSIFEIFTRKLKLSRSFWSFHLTNYHVGFDRTIDELLHLEIIERIKVTIYGITLDMKFLFKLLSICILYIFVHTKGLQERQIQLQQLMPN